MRADFGERVLRAASARPREFRPRTAVVLGSGLSGIETDLKTMVLDLVERL
jgi:purine nucleoside phosphorylase